MQSIKDYQLMGLVCILCGIILVILFVWEITDPQILVTKKLDKNVSRRCSVLQLNFNDSNTDDSFTLRKHTYSNI